MLTVINCVLGLYVVPTICTYLLRRWHYKAYVPYKLEKQGGYYYGATKPDGMDLMIIFFPAFNIFAMFENLFTFIGHSSKIKNKSGKTFMEKFFKL